MHEQTALRDHVTVASGHGRPTEDREFIRGHGTAVLRDADGTVKETVAFTNLVTQQGDLNYGNAYAGLHASGNVADPSAVTGMQLGTGTTAVSKTGAGAAIVTYVAGSDKAIEASHPISSLSGSSRRITWQAVWAAGEATQESPALSEVAIVTRTLDASVATEAQTVSRALLSPTVAKAAGDSLTVTWHHDVEGA